MKEIVSFIWDYFDSRNALSLRRRPGLGWRQKEVSYVAHQHPDA
jgi:hypothetical protein